MGKYSLCEHVSFEQILNDRPGFSFMNHFVTTFVCLKSECLSSVFRVLSLCSNKKFLRIPYLLPCHCHCHFLEIALLTFFKRSKFSRPIRGQHVSFEHLLLTKAY